MLYNLTLSAPCRKIRMQSRNVNNGDYCCVGLVQSSLYFCHIHKIDCEAYDTISLFFKVSGQNFPNSSNAFSGNFYFYSLEPDHTKSLLCGCLSGDLMNRVFPWFLQKGKMLKCFPNYQIKVHRFLVRETYFHYLTVVQNKGKVAFRKEIKLNTTYLSVLYWP